MSSSKIEWTDTVWNPLRGCSRVSEGCRNCYAERQAARNLPGGRSPSTGEPFAILTNTGPRWTGKVELIESKLLEPLHWKKQRRVFVNSMSDLFHENLPIEAIVKVFTVMESAYWHTFQVLTKRACRMREILSHPHFPAYVRKFGYDWLGPKIYNERGPHWRNNVHLGVSIEDQATADERIAELVRTPAAVRFVSQEPTLGPISYRWAHWHDYLKPAVTHNEYDGLRELDWIIVGGESGPHARPFDIEWARNTIRECKAAGVPVFVKQLGSRPFPSKPPEQILLLKDKKGGDWSEWPADLRVREFPKPFSPR